MRGLARPRDAGALDAERAEHDAERQVERLEHRALLDVELEVGRRRPELRVGVEYAIEVDVEPADRVGQRYALAVDELAKLLLVGHRAGGRGRAEQRAPEPCALLVRP